MEHVGFCEALNDHRPLFRRIAAQGMPVSLQRESLRRIGVAEIVQSAGVGL